MNAVGDRGGAAAGGAAGKPCPPAILSLETPLGSTQDSSHTSYQAQTVPQMGRLISTDEKVSVPSNSINGILCTAHGALNPPELSTAGPGP